MLRSLSERASGRERETGSQQLLLAQDYSREDKGNNIFILPWLIFVDVLHIWRWPTQPLRLIPPNPFRHAAMRVATGSQNVIHHYWTAPLFKSHLCFHFTEPYKELGSIATAL